MGERLAPSAPPIFIVGCPRSGTSLLRNLLRSHPRLSFPSESHFIPILYRAYGDPANERAARGLAAKILRLEWVRRWRLDLGPGDFGDCRSYRAIVSRLFEAWMRREGKERWGDKTPQYVSHIPTLSELFPGCQILHIHRDGRDVALSLSARRIGPQNVYAAAQFWKARVSEGRRAGAALPPGRYHEVGYGSLLADPEGTMRGVCGFLGERFDPGVGTTFAAAEAAAAEVRAAFAGRILHRDRPPGGARVEAGHDRRGPESLRIGRRRAARGSRLREERSAPGFARGTTGVAAARSLLVSRPAPPAPR